MQTKGKKRMKLPNNYGSIKYLGAGRRNPYAVYPPVTEWTSKGPITPKALGYRKTWEDAYELLTIYNLEKKGLIALNEKLYTDRSPTFLEIYEKFYQEKYYNSPQKFSEASMRSTSAAFKNCKTLHTKQMRQIRYDDLQNVINNCPLRHASIELMVSLLHQMYQYALKYEFVDKDYSQFLYIPIPDDDEHGIPFNESELKILWEHKDHPVVEMILIMCYSGYRIKAYTSLEVNLTEGYFMGGVKSRAGKKRVVPIHSAIYDLVKRRYQDDKNLLLMNTCQFRTKMYAQLSSLGIEKHTPHDCRHTFSMLCEKYRVNENDRKRMLGHSFGSDITNETYGHRSLEDLRTEIEKIQAG